MVLVGIDARFQVRLATFTVPEQLTIVHVVDDISQLPHFTLQGLDTVRLLDFQRRQSRKVERHIQQRTAHHKGLCQVGRITEVILQSRHTATRMAQSDGRRHPTLLVFEDGLYAQQTEDVAHRRVTLLRTVHQSLQHHFVVLILAQGHHLEPVRCGTPVVLDIVHPLPVRLGLHHDGIVVAPFRISTIFAHHPQRQVDIRPRDDVTRQLQRQSVFQHRTNQQQGGNKLRTDVARHVQLTAVQPLALDAQRRKALCLRIADVRSQTAQGIYQHTNRTVLHALRARQHVLLAVPHRQQGSHKTHGRTAGLDIHFVRIVPQCTDNHLRIVAIRQIIGHNATTR